MNNIKALAIDLDGTLLRPDSSISERTVKTLKLYIDRGVKIIIATGRSLESAEKFCRIIGAEGAMIFFNGAEVVEMPSQKIVYSRFLQAEVIEYCAELAKREGLYYQIYVPDSSKKQHSLLLTEKHTEQADFYYEHTGIKPAVMDFKQIIAKPGFSGAMKSMYLAEGEHHERVKKELYERFGDKICIVRSSPTYLEVLRAGVSKGSGLTHAISYYNISPDNVIAFGDEENDLSMFGTAAFAVALSNAKEEVREQADLVIGSNAEDGIAEFLEQHI